MLFDLSPLERVFEHGPVEVLVYDVTVLPLCHVVVVLPGVDGGAEREGFPHLTDLSPRFLKKRRRKKEIDSFMQLQEQYCQHSFTTPYPLTLVSTIKVCRILEVRNCDRTDNRKTTRVRRGLSLQPTIDPQEKYKYQ